MIKQRGGAPIVSSESYQTISKMSSLLPKGMSISSSVNKDVLTTCKNIVGKMLTGSVPTTYEMVYLRDLFGRDCTADDMKHLYLWVNLSLLEFDPQLF